jgi:hypothetical protein
MSLARNLGLFFGHIAKAVTSDAAPRKPVSQEVARREMTAQTLVDTPEGPQSVTLRRTVIDEVQFPDKPTQQ